MMTDAIKTNVKKNRHWAFLGAGLGVVLIVGYFGYEMAMTPDRPATVSASQAEIVSYIIDPRGMSKLADIEERQFLDAWRERLVTDAEQKSSLKAALTALSSEERKRFIDTMLKQFKRVIVNDAEQFEQLPSSERSAFVLKKTTEFEAQESFVRDLSLIFGAEAPSSDKLREWVFEHTSPQERELCVPYVEAIQRVAEQRRKQRRGEAPRDQA